jgi:hypothetical protein
MRRPLVLFLDDIHWADPSSVDLLAHLGVRCRAWRLLLVLSYRPADLLRTEHPFGPVKLELQGRGVCREIALPFLSRGDLDRYLELAFAGHRFPGEFAAALHARTEGNPLFMVDLLRYLRDRGAIVEDQGRWALVRAVPDLERELPESVRGMIRRKVDVGRSRPGRGRACAARRRRSGSRGRSRGAGRASCPTRPAPPPNSPSWAPAAAPAGTPRR